MPGQPFSGALFLFSAMSQLEIKATALMRLRVLITVGFACLLAAILSYFFLAKSGEFMAAKTDIYTYVPDATGVSTGTPVRLSGIQIGTVTAIRLTKSADPQRAVMVRMTVKARYLKDIPINSTTDIGALTLIGDKYIDIDEGKSAAPLPANGTLASEPAKQAADRADLMRALGDELRQVDAVLVTMSDPNSTLGHFIVGEAEYDSVLATVTGFDSRIRGVVTPQTAVGDLLSSDKLYQSIHKRLLEIDGKLQGIQNGEGTYGRLYLSDDRYRELTAKIRSAHTAIANLNAGKGAGGALLTNDNRYDALVAALNKVDGALASLDTGQGQFARLMRDPQLYESLTGTLHHMEVLLRDFREHPQKYMRYRVFGKKKKKRR